MAARLLATIAVASFAIALATAALAGCGQPGARPATVPLRISGGPATASVTVDDEPIGSFDSVAAHGVALPPGTHRLTVEADGYFPSDQVIDAEPGGAVVRLNVQLEKIPR